QSPGQARPPLRLCYRTSLETPIAGTSPATRPQLWRAGGLDICCSRMTLERLAPGSGKLAPHLGRHEADDNPSKEQAEAERENHAEDLHAQHHRLEQIAKIRGCVRWQHGNSA